MKNEIKTGDYIHIKYVPPNRHDVMQGRFTPRVATYGRVLYTSNRGWVLVGVINKYGQQVFKECFFKNEIEHVAKPLLLPESCEKKTQKLKKIS